MADRLRALIEAFDPDRPLEHARTIPSSWYLDPELARLERLAVFGRTWQAAARADQVDRPGDFATAEIAGEPILVVRGDDGLLRAFSNVCRHRGARVAVAPEGHARRLRCRYHGWTYDLTGRLKGTPEFDAVEDFRREDNGLIPWSVAQWGPLVWVHPGQNPPPLSDAIAPLPSRTERPGLDSLRFVARRPYEIACNWKVFVDNYLDGGYHVNTIHPGLAGVLDDSRYRTELFNSTSVQLSPLETAAGDPSVAAVRKGDLAQYWYIFPNLMINLYQGVMDTNLVLPLAPGRCLVLFDFYFERDDGPDAARFQAESMAVADQIQREDIDICEDVQKGLSSQSFDTGRFSVRRESAGYHFHRLLARSLRAGIDASECSA